jgi:hypothetical protein
VKAEKVSGRGEGEVTDLGAKYWHIAGAETKSTVAADSVVARELLERLQREGQKDGVIRFPEIANDFDHGLLVHAKGAQGFGI